MLKRNSDGIYPKSKLFRLPIKSFSRGKNFQFSPASHRLEFFYNFGDNILLYGCLQYMLFIFVKILTFHNRIIDSYDCESEYYLESFDVFVFFIKIKFYMTSI